MIYPLIKILVSAAVIAFVTWLSKVSPSWGGWIAALPLVSLLSAFWLSMESSPRETADFLTGVLWGLIPTALLLFVLVVSLRQSVSFSISILLGIGAWGVYTYVFQFVILK